MNDLQVGDEVVWSSLVPDEYAGQPAGTVIGFHGNHDVILQLVAADERGNLATVVYHTTLVKKDNF